MNNKRIVIVTSEFPPLPGGIGTHAYQLARHLSGQDYHVSVIADQRSQDVEEELAFDKGLTFEVQRIPLKNWRLLMYFQRIMSTLRCFKTADYVFASGKFALWNVSFCSLFYKTPVLSIIHGTEVNFKPYMLRTSIDMALKRFGTIIAVSNYTKQLVAHLQRDVVVIPNGIVTHDWQAACADTAIVKGYPVLCTIGRVSSRKGQLHVIQHLPDLITTYPDLHYHCIGIPSEAKAFMAVATSLGVQSHVTFHGMVATDHLKLMLSQTDVFVMLSSETASGDVEGFGISILEANAMGIPAIGSKHSGIEDAIKHGVSGLLIDVHDGKGFENAIRTLLAKPSTYKNGALAWAKQHEWSVIVQHYCALLS